MTKYLINEQYDVEDATASRVFSKGENRNDYADGWKGTGNVILIGLPGAGKHALADLLREETGLPVVVPREPTDAVAVLAKGGQIIVLEDNLVENTAIQPLLHRAGKVFYLMADSNTLASRLAERLGGTDKEKLWRDSSARLAAMEPVFYGALHFILQAGESPEAMLADALEKIAY